MAKFALIFVCLALAILAVSAFPTSEKEEEKVVVKREVEAEERGGGLKEMGKLLGLFEDDPEPLPIVMIVPLPQPVPYQNSYGGGSSYGGGYMG